MAQIKGLFVFVISVVKKSDEIFAVNEAKSYYDGLGKAQSDRYGIRIPE